MICSITVPKEELEILIVNCAIADCAGRANSIKINNARKIFEPLHESLILIHLNLRLNISFYINIRIDIPFIIFDSHLYNNPYLEKHLEVFEKK